MAGVAEVGTIPGMTIYLALPGVVALLGTLLYFLPTSELVRRYAMAWVLAGMVGICMGRWWGDVRETTAVAHDRR